jgi:hypothetical protein
MLSPERGGARPPQGIGRPGADIDQMPHKKIVSRALDSGHRVNGLLISLELIR